MTLRDRWLKSSRVAGRQGGRAFDVAYSIADQGFSVGGMFLANVALARAVSKEEYGVFALAYSAFTFLGGLHNAAILETYTVYGAGRYREDYEEYRWLTWRSNSRIYIGLTGLLFLVWILLSRSVPHAGSQVLLGLALSSGVMLTATLVRRMLYIQRKPQFAARLSATFFLSLLGLLWIALRFGRLNNLTIFLIVAVSWVAGGLAIFRQLPRRVSVDGFLDARPNHWAEHWTYARWVLATAFVFQLTTQGYYWLVAAFLSVKQVAALRAIYMLVTPLDQVFAALTLLVLPMMAARYASGQVRRLLSLWRVYLSGLIAVGSLFALGVWLLGKPLVNRIYGGKFDDASALLSVLALLPIIMGVGNTINAVMKAMEKPKMVLYAYIASGSATFLIGIPLVKSFGLRGAAYGMLASAGAYTATLAAALIILFPRLKVIESREQLQTHVTFGPSSTQFSPGRDKEPSYISLGEVSPE